MALESMGLQEDSGQGYICPFSGRTPPWIRQCPLWSPELGPLDPGLMTPRQVRRTQSPTLSYFYLSPAQTDLSQQNSKQVPPGLKILPWLPSALGAKSKLLQALEALQI